MVSNKKPDIGIVKPCHLCGGGAIVDTCGGVWEVTCPKECMVTRSSYKKSAVEEWNKMATIEEPEDDKKPSTRKEIALNIERISYFEPIDAALITSWLLLYPKAKIINTSVGEVRQVTISEDKTIITLG